MRRFPSLLIVGGWLAFGAAAAAGADATKAQALFERVFGDAVRLDPAMVTKVKAAKPGTRVLVDRDGDGKHDEAWFIDTAMRHTDALRPILVRVIDEDGDLDVHQGPDLDSDLYIVDWHADGTADVVLDYQDNDGDHDVDEMAFFFYMPHHRFFGDDVLRVWWGQDDGDDNLLWYDIDYTYYQDRCQYRCHFGGDESLVAFGLLPDSSQWASAFENPFLFYDLDGDQCTEVVLRVEGVDDQIRRVRYSFDADDDAYGRRAHDFDFSITAIVEDDDPVRPPAAMLAGKTLRGIPTQKWLQRKPARAFIENAPWTRMLLTWDEMNANTEADVARDPHERWEGILNHGSEHFPQVGGPPCSPLNKRNEVSLKPTPPMQLYFDPTDHRLHLKGVTEGWLHVDFDFDGTADAKYTYLEEGGDGIFDRRRLDLDADGTVDFDWPMTAASPREVGLEFQSLTTFYKQMLTETLDASQVFVDAAKAAIQAASGACPTDPAETYFLTTLVSWTPETQLGKRMRATPAGARFYMDLVRDRLLLSLKKTCGDTPVWERIETLYAGGDYAAAAKVVREELASRAAMPNPAAFRSFTRRIPLRLDNRGGAQRDAWPVTIRVSELRGAVADFNPANCAVVAPERWLDWRQVPHQVDEIDPAVGVELSFLVDLAADAESTWYLYYSPTGRSDDAFERKTATAEDWVPPNIGWESNRVAYRAYWGQFDFFGKKADRLLYDDIGAESYHAETPWGIDALHVGEASGIGGLTLYDGDKAWLVQNPAGKGDVKFTKRQIVQGPVRCAIEITAKNVVPEQPELAVRMQCVMYADRDETEILARVSGSTRSIGLAPGLVKLPRERFQADATHGWFGSWGYQQAVIGEIGMGLIVAPGVIVDEIDLPEERRVRCRTAADGTLRYWVIGDWRCGRQYPVAPTIDNWSRELRVLADQLLREVPVAMGKVEDIR
ncbi:MAG: DUF4861 family protein [Phycisphaerae bacterium]|nr:DUF4861 family protein [Phycisphaerae bacterium]